MSAFQDIERADSGHAAFAERVRDPIAFDEPHGFHFSAKDNLCAIGFQARAGSRILEGYRPPFDAAPVERLRRAGGLLVGKTNMDEFGFGSFSTTSAFGVPRNPFDRERCCGGSSGGAAAAACLIPGHLALGVSTGGSISCPAAFCGVYGLTPTYGRVSRYGLIDYGTSLDKVGILSREAGDLRTYLPVISGPDERDPTSLAQPELDMSGSVSSVAVPRGALSVSDDVKRAFASALESLRSSGVEVAEVDMPSLRFAVPAYYVLATSEASTNLARYCGMRFGVMNDRFDQSFNTFFSQVRSSQFGDEAKRRVLLGTFSRMVGFRDKYYMKALQARQLIIREYESVFQDFDAVLTPTMPFLPPRFDEISKMRPLESYQADFLTVPPNLSGLPHLSMPCGYSGGLPIGMQAVAPHWREGRLVSMAEAWSSRFQLKLPEASS